MNRRNLYASLDGVDNEALVIRVFGCKELDLEEN